MPEPVTGADATARAAEQVRGVAAVFDAVAETYDAVGVPWFTPIAEALVRQVAPQAGEVALDLGCGRGAAAFAVAAAVGDTGRVTGLDASASMIVCTQADVSARGLTTIDLRIGDASAPDLPAAAYDLATASLVLFFLPDPAAAVLNWFGLLRPGGRLAVSTFAERDPDWAELDAGFRSYLPPYLLDARTTGTSGPFSSDAGVAALLSDAGFVDVRTSTAEFPVALDDVRHWHSFSRSHGQRAMWDFVPEADVPTLLERAAGILERRRDTDGRIRLRQSVRFTAARRPPG